MAIVHSVNNHLSVLEAVSFTQVKGTLLALGSCQWPQEKSGEEPKHRLGAMMAAVQFHDSDFYAP